MELGQNVEEVWRRCVTDDQRRTVLLGQIERLSIHRAAPSSRAFNPERVRLQWRTDSRAVVPPGVVLEGPIPPDIRPQPAWISLATAVELTGHTETTIRTAVEAGAIDRRHTHHSQPSLSRTSVIVWAANYQHPDRTIQAWISLATAHQLTGHSKRRIHTAIAQGHIHQRTARRPSLSRESVLAWAADYQALSAAARRGPRPSPPTNSPDAKRAIETAISCGKIHRRTTHATRPTLFRTSVLEWASAAPPTTS